MADFDAVMWDFGGVFSASPFTTVAALGREKNYDADLYFGAIFGPYDADTDHPWHRLERGEIDFVSAREAIMEAAKAQRLKEEQQQQLYLSRYQRTIPMVVPSPLELPRYFHYQLQYLIGSSSCPPHAAAHVCSCSE